MEGYFNPYGDLPEMPGTDRMERMTENEREDVTRTHIYCGCASVVVIVAALLLLALFSGCRSTKYVAVPQVHSEHHWHTDTVRQTDSIIDRQTTVVREVDSATLAQYGIQMSAIQTAWLIQSDRMQRELSRLRESKSDTVVVRDSIPYPVEVIREVAKPLAWWKKGLITFGALFIVLMLFRRRPKAWF